MRSAADSRATWSTPPARKNFQRCLLIQRSLCGACENSGQKARKRFGDKIFGGTKRNKAEQWKWPKVLRGMASKRWNGARFRTGTQHKDRCPEKPSKLNFQVLFRFIFR